MWAAILASRPVRYAVAVLGAVAAVLVAALALLSRGRSEGRAEVARSVQAQTIKTMEAVDEAAAAYRGDGAARRLRDGSF